MEAIGTLAGGIAHDFNNLSAVILGYTDLAKEDSLLVINEQEDIPRGNERVLIIDDDAILADMAKDILERLGSQVTVRYNSSQALEIFQNDLQKLDLVITDQTMQGDDWCRPCSQDAVNMDLNTDYPLYRV